MSIPQARRPCSRPARTGASAPFRLSILSQIADRCRRRHEGRDRGRALCRLGQGRPAVQAPVLGRGRGDLRRHQLYRFADPPDRLSQHRLQSLRARRVARRLSVRRRQCLRIHRDDARRAGRARRGVRRHDSSAIQGRVRKRRCRGLAPGAVHARLQRRLERGGARAALRQSVPDRRADRARRRARIRRFRHGRRGRSCPRSTRLRGCTIAS